MKNFFVKIIATTLIIVTNTLLLNYLYKHTNYWQDENDVKKFKTIPYNVQLANVGSSHGQHSFKYDVSADYRCANLGLGNQRHDMDCLVLKQYIDHMAENAVLIIPISYFEITEVVSNFNTLKAAYYRILSAGLIPNYSKVDDIHFNKFPILSAKENIIRILNDSPESFRFAFRQFIPSEHLLQQYGLEKYNEWTAPVTDKGKNIFVYNQQALSKIIDLCYEHNIKPVLITTPITDVLNEYFDNHDGFFDTFYRFIDEVQKKYPDIPYFDYSHDERFSPDHTLFIDSDHLNLWGAEKFTRIVVSDLENAGLLQKPQSTATNIEFDD